MDFLLYDIDYVIEAGNPVIRLWGKAKDGTTVVALDRSFKPYFYFELDDKSREGFDLAVFGQKMAGIRDAGAGFVRAEIVEKKLLGEPKKFVKVTAQKPGDIRDLKSGAERWPEVRKAYEYDIPLYRRYLIDKGLTPMGWVSVSGSRNPKDGAETIDIRDARPAKATARSLNVLAMDIELCGDEIIMVSLVGEGFRKVLTYGWEGFMKGHVEILRGEKEMLERLAEAIVEKDPDIIVTYNGDIFDFVKIMERADVHKIPFNIGRDSKPPEFVKRGRTFSAFVPGRVHLDLYIFIDRILGSSLESETLTLDMVSRELLGEGKDALAWSEIEKLWKERKNLESIADYCLKDSELALRLSRRLMPQIFELSMLIGQTPFDASRMTYSQLVEWLLIRSAHERNEIALNRPERAEMEKRREAPPFAGGYVLLPEPGIREDIALFDFASLYPTTIITHNISPETLDRNGMGGSENAVPESDHYFSLEHKGFIPEIIEGLVKKRAEIKKEMEKAEPNSSRYRDLYNRQYALKIIANASYGYYAYAGSRWYSRICAMSIAAFGRYYIQSVIAFARRQGMNVIYGDTDSLFIANCSERDARKFLHEANGTLPGVMELEFEGVYASGIFVPAKSGATAKKRYALLGRDGKITIRGFEKVRRDWCKIAKDTQEKVLFAILRDRDEKKAVGIVRGILESINKGDVDSKDLIIYTQLTKPVKSYEQIGPHVAAAMKYAARGQTVKAGSVIGYIITRGDGSISQRAEPFEYAQNYDPEYYIYNQILPAAMRIFYGLGLSEEDVLGDSQDDSQRSLDTFMKKSLRKRMKKKFEEFKDG